MIFDIYLITVVSCRKESVKKVAYDIFEQTAIFKRMQIFQNSIYIFTDTNKELVELDKEHYIEILTEIEDVLNFKQFISKEYDKISVFP